MKLCHVAHGLMPIPPKGWGAIEAHVWDYKRVLELRRHEVLIVNDTDVERVAAAVRRAKPDVLHVHCERFFSLAQTLGVPVTILASQWPRLFEHGQEEHALSYLSGTAYVCCASDRIERRCVEIGLARARLFVARNGARADLYRMSANPRFADRAICLAAVNSRKRQYLLAGLPFVDFAGPLHREATAFAGHKSYLGEWSKATVYEHLTDYASLVLLSRAEVAPLVTCEALMAGLGVVVSEAAAANLDGTLPFVTIIPERLVADSEAVADAIRANQRIARAMRADIRHYAVRTFDCSVLVDQYIARVQGFLDQS